MGKADEAKPSTSKTSHAKTAENSEVNFFFKMLQVRKPLKLEIGIQIPKRIKGFFFNEVLMMLKS